MLRFFVLLLLVCAVFARRPHFERERDDDDLWEKFKDKFDKAYESEDEEQKRRGTFFKHVDIITRHNLEADLGLHSFRLGLNEYADMENDEFRRTLNGYRMKDRRELPHREHFQPRRDRDIPDTIDWRDKGMVTPIKNQGQCGSCWAFSTTGSVEGQTMKKTGKLVSLSEQNLVDCSGKQGNEGCEGGLMDQAFEYIIENKGIDTEASYPYTAEDGTCKFKRSTVGATITGYKDIPSGDEDALKQAAATIGPISVAIDASSILFQLYSGGIYDDPDCSTDLLDHGVLVIGYGTDEGQDYWLVKNSWGTSWGLDGYIKMSRNKSNQCGIATQASYPTV